MRSAGGRVACGRSDRRCLFIPASLLGGRGGDLPYSSLTASMLAGKPRPDVAVQIGTFHIGFLVYLAPNTWNLVSLRAVPCAPVLKRN